jgi:uncharacterized protein
MIIDINQHWLPEDLFSDKDLLDSFIRIVPRAYGEYAHVGQIPGSKDEQIIIEKPKGYENLNFGPKNVDHKDKLASMDKAGVDKAFLRIPCWQEWLDIEMCKRVNDSLAAFVKKNPTRFLGLAVVPPWGDKACLNEADRVINKLGFAGIEMAAHYGTLYLDAEEFKPYFKKLNQLNVPICVHHTPLPVEYNSVYKYVNLRRLYGRCIDQGTAVGRELFSGMFSEFPNLKMIHTMLGGAFFGVAGLLVRKKPQVVEEIERFDLDADKFGGYLENNLFFDMAHAPPWGKAQLECAVKVLGADHILWGSSYPLRNEWLFKGVDYIKSLDISEKDKELILGGNAARLFKIKS